MMAHFNTLTLPDIRPKGVPAGVSAILQTAVAKNPDERYTPAGEVARALTMLAGVELEATSQDDRLQKAVVAVEVMPAATESEKSRNRHQDDQELTAKAVAIVMRRITAEICARMSPLSPDRKHTL